MVYAPGTLETDPKKQNMALQQQASAIKTVTADTATNAADIATNTTNIAANTAAIAALNAATYVNSIAGNSGAFTLGSGLNNSANVLQVAAGVPLRFLQNVDTTNRSVSSTSYAATGSTSTSITPASSSNKIRIQVGGILGSSASVSVHVTLYRSINGGAYADITPSGSGEMQSTVITSTVLSQPLSIDFIDSPATVQSVQYQIYMKSNAASTIYLGRRATDTLLNAPTVLTVTEIKG